MPQPLARTLAIAALALTGCWGPTDRPLPAAMSLEPMPVPGDAPRALALSGARGSEPLGSPIAGLTRDQRKAFDRGKALFATDWAAPALGPVFNGSSCLSCHHAGGPGGSHSSFGATRMGAVHAGPAALVTGEGFDPLLALGGPILQRTAVAGTARERLPSAAEVAAHFGDDVARVVITSRRATTAVAGNGYLVAVPDAAIRARAALNQKHPPFGTVKGHPNVMPDGRIGKLGHKAQWADNMQFLADAALEEVGLSNAINAHENQPNGPSRPVGEAEVDLTRAQMDDIEAFCMLLAPPRPAKLAHKGQVTMVKTGCTSCHWNGYRTTTRDADLPESLRGVKAIKGRRVTAYTDLLLHRLSPALADGFPQGQAAAAEWRTAPLWGLRHRTAFLHDNRAASLDEAIRMHAGEGSEANPVIDRYEALSRAEREALLEFLQSL